MNHSEKAKELIEKYLNQEINFAYIDTQDGQCVGAGYMTYNSAKDCAIIHVEGILEVLQKIEETGMPCVPEKNDWQQVKKELFL